MENKIFEGKISTHKKGFGFIKTEDKQYFFVPKKYRNSSLHGDIVKFKIIEPAKTEKDNAIVKVVEILERVNNYIVVTCDTVNGKKVLIPDDKKITEWIKIKNFSSLKSGYKLLLKIDKVVKQDIFCSFEKYVGKKSDIGIDMLSIVASHGVNVQFPKKVIVSASKVPDKVLPKQKEGRVDLTKEKIITIDGASAKDLDDAIRVERLENGNFLLGVYIADVSYYVDKDSIIDKEAYERATSIYLADRVIPMLPENLSNGICSLNPQVERLTMACEMEINSSGKVVDSKLFESVIKTTERMTYSDVNKIYDGDLKLISKYQHIYQLLVDAKELSEAISIKKNKAGMLDFDIDESEIKFDDKGKAIDVVLKPRGFSEKMIEQFMVCANETVGSTIEATGLTSIYRVHGTPPLEKLEEFYKFARHFGKHFEAKQKDVKPKDIQKILNLYKNEPYFYSIAVQVLRSMAKAVYSEKNIGHFGLASKSYSHFTSPIRRYPDLILHRLIGDYILSEDAINTKYWKKNMAHMAEHTSDKERRAIDIERQTMAVKKAEWALGNIGREFEATIVSLIDFGMFVKIPNGVEGLIHMSDLIDDAYSYNETLYAIEGKTKKRKFNPGDLIKVFIKSANKDDGKVDFGLTEFKIETIKNMEAWNKKSQHS